LDKGLAGPGRTHGEGTVGQGGRSTADRRCGWLRPPHHQDETPTPTLGGSSRRSPQGNRAGDRALKGQRRLRPQNGLFRGLAGHGRTHGNGRVGTEAVPPQTAGRDAPTNKTRPPTPRGTPVAGSPGKHAGVRTLKLTGAKRLDQALRHSRTHGSGTDRRLNSSGLHQGAAKRWHSAVLIRALLCPGRLRAHPSSGGRGGMPCALLVLPAAVPQGRGSESPGVDNSPLSQVVPLRQAEDACRR
jgi:hypothetical protein